MDVHPPHEPIHTWRDFLLHLATITVGLLIALGLEAAVEGLHHRHIVREARENIRRELESNREAAAKDSLAVQQNADNMRLDLLKARRLRDDPHSLDHGEMHFNFSWDSFYQSAWQTARDTGALAYMSTGEVQSYSEIYGQQEIVNRQAVDIFTHQSEDVVPLEMEETTAKIRPEDVHTLMVSTTTTYVRLTTLKQLVDQLHTQYENALRK